MTRQVRWRAVRTLRGQGAPPGIYASKYTPELGAFICSRLAAGESLRAICREDRSMPTEKTVWNWAQAHPQFAAMRASALTFARANARDVHRARAEARAARPASASGRRAWNRGRSSYTPERAEAICQRLCLGEPLYVVCRDPEMPSVGTVYRWLQTRPEFLEAYRTAKSVAFLFVIDMAMDAAPWLETEAATMRALAKAQKAALRRCGLLAPRQYAETIYVVRP